MNGMFGTSGLALTNDRAVGPTKILGLLGSQAVGLG